METITAAGAPEAIGPYSHAVRVGHTVYCSGQLPVNPDTGELVEGATADQAKQVLTNLEAVLKAASCDLSRVLKTTIYLTDMADFPEVNAAYEAAFSSHRPARATVAVAALPLGAKVEIDCIAAIGEL